MRPAVFLDRDGTLIEEVHFLSRVEDLAILPGVPEALERLGQAGYLRVVVTNQSGVARGYFDLDFVARTHTELRRMLRARGTDVDGFYVCPHGPDQVPPCACRKPAPGLALRAAQDLGVDLAASWVVGDRSADVALAHNVGCRAALVRTGYGQNSEADPALQATPPDVVADDLARAAEEMLNR